MIVTLIEDYMILVDYFAGIPAVLQIPHELYPAITCKKFYLGKAGSFFCNARIPFCLNEILPCKCNFN